MFNKRRPYLLEETFFCDESEHLKSPPESQPTKNISLS